MAVFNAEEDQPLFQSKLPGLLWRTLNMVPMLLKSQRNKLTPKISGGGGGWGELPEHCGSVSNFLSARQQQYCVNKRWRKGGTVVPAIIHYRQWITVVKHRMKMPVLLFQQSKDERKGWIWIPLHSAKGNPAFLFLIQFSIRALYSAALVKSNLTATCILSKTPQP